MTAFNTYQMLIKRSLVVLLVLMTSACTTDVPSVSPQQAATLLHNKQAIIVDVREQDEWNEQHIAGALLMPLSTFDQQLDALLPYKDSPVIMQCRSGRRSEQAAQILIKAGFKQVSNLEGGILAWHDAKLETVSGP